MKSSEIAVRGVMQQLGQTATAISPAAALPTRAAPLEHAGIVQMEAALSLVVDEIRTPHYGQVIVRDGKGDAYRSEFGVIGESVEFRLKGVLPQKLADAIARPAHLYHIVFHLGRLAAHRRDTRGAPAFGVVTEDIARDLAGVSEWAVIRGCKEMRQREKAWYPTTGEIERIIRAEQVQIDQLVAAAANRPALAAPAAKIPKPPEPPHRGDIPKAWWTAAQHREHVSEAEKMLALAEAHPHMFDAARWSAEAARRRDEAAKAGVEIQSACEG